MDHCSIPLEMEVLEDLVLSLSFLMWWIITYSYVQFLSSSFFHHDSQEPKWQHQGSDPTYKGEWNHYHENYTTQPKWNNPPWGTIVPMDDPPCQQHSIKLTNLYQESKNLPYPVHSNGSLLLVNQRVSVFLRLSCCIKLHHPLLVLETQAYRINISYPRSIRKYIG